MFSETLHFFSPMLGSAVPSQPYCLVFSQASFLRFLPLIAGNTNQPFSFVWCRELFLFSSPFPGPSSPQLSWALPLSVSKHRWTVLKRANPSCDTLGPQLVPSLQSLPTPLLSFKFCMLPKRGLRGFLEGNSDFLNFHIILFCYWLG